MEFRLLGPLQVVVAGQAVPLGGSRQRSILAVLLLEATRPVPRDRLIDEVWGDRPPPTVVAALHVHIAHLRKVIGDRLATLGTAYQLLVGPDEVDAGRFEAAVAEARSLMRTRPAAAAARLQEALRLWRGPALSGVALGPLSAAAAARLDELHLVALEERTELDLGLGRHDELVPELKSLVAANPTRERLSARLMLALHRGGRTGEALAVYDALCGALDEHVGVDPSDELVALAKAIRRGDPTLAAPAGSLPTPAGSFVGREQELADLPEVLGASRLLTLAGPGGSGKTRLAVELARSVLSAHPHGVDFVDLSGLGPDGSVARTVAAALGVRQRPGETLTATLAVTLKGRRVLVVLDNCEHVVAASAALCAELLEHCPGLRILATSRQPLHVPGEVVRRISGLALPPAGAGADATAGSDAVRLLADRARAAGAEVVVDGEDAAVAADVCRRLDGLPLAIELVAARLGSLSLDEVAARLDSRLALLSGSRTVRPRHRTMRAAIGWSHDLLEPPERALFRRLAPFSGGFDLAAAEAVGADPEAEPPVRPEEVAPLLAALADRSMVVVEPGQPRGIRYRLLEILREYAAERLGEAGEEPPARRRHAAWYRRLAEGAGRHGGPGHESLVAQLVAELDNLRGALAWYLGEGRDPAAALAMAAPVWWFWWVRGEMGEGRAWLRRALAGADPEITPARGFALRAVGALARNSGDYQEARGLGEQSLAVYRALGDAPGIAAAVNNLAITVQALGDLQTALKLGTESVEWARRAGSRRGIAASQNNLGSTLRCLGRLDEAEGLFQESLAAFSALDDRRGQAAALLNLAFVERLRGRLAPAWSLAVRGLALFRELDLMEGELDAVEAIACLEVAGGRAAAALRLLAVADRERANLGAPVFVPDEVAQRAAAQAAARAALGTEESDRVLTRAAEEGLPGIVTELLAAAVPGVDTVLTSPRGEVP
ncbi:MAG TPA: BTAD domain-containing putative transcriptional regulator [Candidatus Dormibacteraeota bacterium]|nr:BTAD domain-containing putative transcriptional regulator [Candidatus Dormibacteraeota bacterium]